MSQSRRIYENALHFDDYNRLWLAVSSAHPLVHALVKVQTITVLVQSLAGAKPVTFSSVADADRCRQRPIPMLPGFGFRSRCRFRLSVTLCSAYKLQHRTYKRQTYKLQHRFQCSGSRKQQEVSTPGVPSWICTPVITPYGEGRCYAVHHAPPLVSHLNCTACTILPNVLCSL